MAAADEVTLSVGDAELAGWEEVRVTRRIEACPNDFDISMTERFPLDDEDFVVQAGDPCVLSIGGDVVITGYVDRYSRTYSGGAHTVSISGRGKTQDLVDCSAEYPSGQISGTLLTIAQTLASPYGITVTSLSGPGPQIPQFNLTRGETAWDIIERICRFAGLLAYEGSDGNLILANTQATQAACGFEEGVNVQSAHVLSAMDQRHSKVVAFMLSMETLSDVGRGGDFAGSADDLGVPRHRLKYIIAEAIGGGREVAKKRAQWEVNRNAGRAFTADITTDSWRDSDGTLWTPNTQAPVDLPGLKLTGVTWTLGEVTYRRGASGTTCQVLLADPSAYQPEPLLLVPEIPNIVPGTAQGPG